MDHCSGSKLLDRYAGKEEGLRCRSMHASHWQQTVSIKEDPHDLPDITPGTAGSVPVVEPLAPLTRTSCQRNRQLYHAHITDDFTYT